MSMDLSSLVWSRPRGPRSQVGAATAAMRDTFSQSFFGPPGRSLWLLVGAGCPSDQAGVVTVEEVQQDQFVGPGPLCQLGQQGHQPFGSLPEHLARWIVRVLVRIVEQRSDVRAFGAPALSDTGIEVWRIGVLGSIAGGTALGPLAALLYVESGVCKQAIGGIHAQLPPRFGTLGAIEHAQHLHDGIAVGSMD